MPTIEIGSVMSKELLGFLCQSSYRERSAFIHDPSLETWSKHASPVFGLRGRSFTYIPQARDQLKKFILLRDCGFYSEKSRSTFDRL